MVKISDFGLARKLSADQRKDGFKNLYKNGSWKIKSDEEEKLIKNERLPITKPIRWLSPEALLFDHFSIKSDVSDFFTIFYESFTKFLIHLSSLYR